MAASYKNAQIKIDGPDLYEIRKEFERLPRNIAASVIGAGLKRAAAPGEAALKRFTPKTGPTGNLFRAIKTIVKKYPRDGVAVAVVGYVKAGSGASKSAGGGKVRKGKDRAFHQFWLEFGTKDRLVTTPGDRPYMRSNGVENRKLRKALGTKQANELKSRSTKVRGQGGFIASSFGTLGPFRFTTPKQGMNKGRLNTSPKYPKAFFIKRNKPIVITGVSAQRPVQNAYNASKGAIASNLKTEMQKALQNGLKIMEDRARRASQMKDLGRHL